MKYSNVAVFCLLMSALAFSCTPKTGAPIAEAEETPPQEETTPDTTLSPCTKFSDTPYEEEALDNYVLYRDQIKAGNFEAAFPMWKRVYELAPAADGKRKSVFLDGIAIYHHFFEGTTNEPERQGYLQRIMNLYDQAITCYGEEAYINGLRAFDYYYKYAEYTTPVETYRLFKKTIDGLGLKTPVFVLNPFTALLVQVFNDNKIKQKEAQQYAKKVFDILAYNKGKKTSEQWTGEGWDIVEGYAPVRLEEFEGVEGFYDCTYYLEKYYPEYQAAPADCEIIKKVYGRLLWGDCDKESEEVLELKKALFDNDCIEVVTTGPSVARQAYEALREGRFKEAVRLFEEAAEASDDNERKAKYYLLIAKIYYGELKQFSTSRTYALKAAEYKSNWGEPYILIGKLYASSGPLCGPGRGWDSQVVTWPAIDKWQYAKRIDSSVASEASKLIRQYEQYMPSKEDIFQRLKKEGDSFTVGCWIQEKTVIRAAPK